jgi:two-component system, OmpR family, phosphate regulon sensor histidine kinase PhoR
MSLRNQFLIIFLIIQIIVLVILLFYFNHNLSNIYLNQLKLSLLHENKLLVRNKNLNLTEYDTDEINNWVKKISSEIDSRITVINKYGIVIADSSHNPFEMDNHLNRPEIASVLGGMEYFALTRKSDTLDVEMYYLAYPIKDGEEIIGVIRLAKSLKAINEVIYRNFLNYLIFFTVVLLLTFILAWQFSANIMEPLKMVTRVLGKIAHGKFYERIKFENYKNEIGTMARAFNYMAGQLESKVVEISQEKNRIEAILSSMADGVIATDINRKVVIVNPEAKKMLYLTEEGARGRKLIEVLRHHKIDSLLEKALKENTILSEEINFQRNENQIYQCHFAPITDEDNNVIGGVIVLNNITELRKLEQVRTEFVANVSHELRTPLTSIIGYVDTLIESEIQDPVISKKFLKIIKFEADRLALLIRDLLDLSKLEGNLYENKMRANDLMCIIEKTIEILKEKAEEKNISLNIDIKETLPLVNMIPEQIEQVFINLIDNGIKYTPEGGKVTIRSYCKKDRVIIEIIDNGIGIPEEDKGRIFERFYRVDKARSRALGGTGIGLSIVKHIIQAHKSKIEVESDLSKGTLFRFYLKRA